jgi:predicted Fe-Mo cluster-binding NifX family protein
MSTTTNPVIACVPVTADGRQLDPRWGKAAYVAVARVEGGAIAAWEIVPVGWDALHDVGTEGGHHARVARFLLEHHVQVVVANHMGPPMEQMLRQMRLGVRLGAGGDARAAVLAAVSEPAGGARVN